MKPGSTRFAPMLAALAALIVALPAPQATALSSDVVISQVYGGGGNTGAPYTNDYVELFNRGSTPVSLAGMSVQYASSTGTGNFGSNPVTLLAGTLAPGQAYLVQMAGGAIGAALPAPDVTGTVSMSAAAGKVALVTSTSGLACNGGSTPCTVDQLALIKDLVGYGTANFYEGAPAPALSSVLAAVRLGGGCTETDNNATDFIAATPEPRNTATALAPCAVVDAAPSVASTYPAQGATDFPVGAALSVTFSEPVNVSATAFQLTCTSKVDITVSGGPVTFTLAPAAALAYGESCTLTVVASAISDQDANDPPDAMTADFTLGFSLAADVCAQTYTAIYAIQGSGLSAAITGTVTTQGVVVGDFEGSSQLSGFYLQDPIGDGNAATSDGIFVFTGSANLVSAGQLVRVTGFARERFEQTTLNGSNSNSAAVPAANIVNCGTGAVTPVDVTFPVASADDLERYEGMLVRFPQPLQIAEYFNFDRFGEIVLALPLDGESRPFTGTAVDEPGAAANARTLANSLRRILLDDGSALQNPAVLRHPNGLPFTLDNRFRGGDVVQNAVGVLGYDFSVYRLQPTAHADYVPANPRPAAPDAVGGTLRVAAMSTLNFFVTADAPTGSALDNKCGPLQNVECRGWDSDQADEYNRQRTKLLSALAASDADVIGLTEVENTSGVDPLAALVSGLPGYARIDTGVVGTDAIRVGLMYRPAKVAPVGAFKILDSAVDPRFLDAKNRPALAQTFQDLATGGRFTVVVNHLKSKGSDCNDVGDPDTGDGQGNCNLTRTLATRALVDWLATDPTSSGDPDFLVVGDLNAYAMEDPLVALAAGPDDTPGNGDDYRDLLRHYVGRFAYSYVFDAQAGALDHAFASASLKDQVAGAAHWHINADEPDVLDYDTTFKPPAQDALYEANAYRTSDHDMVIVGLTLVNHAPELGTVVVTPAVVAVNAEVSASTTFTDRDRLDTHTATWTWGDGSSSPGTIAEANGTGSANGSHSYAMPGAYAVEITVSDSYGNEDRARYEYVLVYDPAAGFVAGGGWIASPAGADAGNPALTGKATFSVDAKYTKGQTVPTGKATFQFPAGNLDFAATRYVWLGVGGSRAELIGRGTVNGAGDYGFMIVADDAKPDTFRISIWRDGAGGIESVYDNGTSQPLGGGNVTIRK